MANCAVPTQNLHSVCRLYCPSICVHYITWEYNTFFRRSALIRRTVSAFASGINSPRLQGDLISVEKSFQLFTKSQSEDVVDSAQKDTAPALANVVEFVRPAVPKLGGSEKKISFRNLAHSVVRQISIHEVEKEQVELCPKVEGRIFTYDDSVCICPMLCLLSNYV